jgi:hypothetical protein
MTSRNKKIENFPAVTNEFEALSFVKINKLIGRYIIPIQIPFIAVFLSFFPIK